MPSGEVPVAPGHVCGSSEQSTHAGQPCSSGKILEFMENNIP